MQTNMGNWWARRLFKKNNVCDNCGKHGKTDLHHRDENQYNNNPLNVIEVCRSCHIKIHRPVGKCCVCGKKTKAYGYCDSHWKRMKKWGFTKEDVSYQGARR